MRLTGWHARIGLAIIAVVAMQSLVSHQLLLLSPGDRSASLTMDGASGAGTGDVDVYAEPSTLPTRNHYPEERVIRVRSGNVTTLPTPSPFALPQGGPLTTRPVEFAATAYATDGARSCASGNHARVPLCYGEQTGDRTPCNGMKLALSSSTVCVAWTFQRAQVLQPVGFLPAPGTGRPVVVDGIPFIGASPGVTLWRVEDAHATHTDEGTVVWTRTHMFPMSFNNPGSLIPAVIPFRYGLRSFNTTEFERLLVLGGSMWCHLIQHWVMEGLPLLEAAYDLIHSDPQLKILTPSGGAYRLTRLALPDVPADRFVMMRGSTRPNHNTMLYYGRTVFLPDFSFRGCYASPPGLLAHSRVLSNIRGTLPPSEPNLVVFLWRARDKGQGRALLNGESSGCCVVASSAAVFESAGRVHVCVRRVNHVHVSVCTCARLDVWVCKAPTV
jgi:hypothetical protein